jgi:hypothetical protein
MYACTYSIPKHFQYKNLTQIDVLLPMFTHKYISSCVIYVLRVMGMKVAIFSKFLIKKCVQLAIRVLPNPVTLELYEVTYFDLSFTPVKRVQTSQQIFPTTIASNRSVSISYCVKWQHLTHN